MIKNYLFLKRDKQDPSTEEEDIIGTVINDIYQELPFIDTPLLILLPVILEALNQARYSDTKKIVIDSTPFSIPISTIPGSLEYFSKSANILNGFINKVGYSFFLVNTENNKDFSFFDISIVRYEDLPELIAGYEKLIIDEKPLPVNNSPTDLTDFIHSYNKKLSSFH
ncbi:MAG: hypothetical protein M0R77_01205 [Gammaproteobacteria bacterium]|nr:hypothetical protein [Gammaproteobacteria bacterium]